MDHSYELSSSKEVPTDSPGKVEDTVVEEYVEEQILLDEEEEDGDNEEVLTPEELDNFYTKLIDLVRSHPNIYDKFDTNFKSAVAREKAWNNIATELKISVAYAQNRWTRLRERFAREKKALEVMNKTGCLNDRKKLWPFFLPMLFLSSHVKPRKTSLSGSNDNAFLDPQTGEMTLTKILSVMSKKVNDDSSVPSTSSGTKKSVEVIDNQHPEFLAWRKRKSDSSPNQSPRKILAKPEKKAATIVISSDGKDGKRLLTKFPPGALILKNPPGLASTPVVLFPAPTANGLNLNKPATVPVILSAQPQQIQQANNDPSPVPNSAEHHFGMLIARELERFPKEVRAKKKQRILMVLYE